MIKSSIQRLAGMLGYRISRAGIPGMPIEWRTDPKLTAICAGVSPFTMTSPERIAGLTHAVRHVVRNGIPGACVECGVWRGGSSMAVCLSLLDERVKDRDIFLYDTFSGMSEPTQEDLDCEGNRASDQLSETPRGKGVWCEASIQDVEANMRSTGYPWERIHLVRGKIEDTIPATIPDGIALLRLDTDWYESTRHELEHLYAKLCVGGVLILDDYGHWQGARKAVDEFFRSRDEQPLLMPLDFTGRIMVKWKQ